MLTDSPDVPLILVVEDDDGHAELIQRSLDADREEYRLEFAGTIGEAKAAMERLVIGLLLSDYQLPDGYGNELVGFAAGSSPVIMMTAQGNEAVAVAAMKTGVYDYIVKSPQAFKNLPRTVSHALLDWRLQLERRQAAEAEIAAKKDWERTFDALPDLVAIIDLNHTIMRANRAMAQRCGIPVDDLVGRKCHEVVHGLTHPHAFCPHVRMMRDGPGDVQEVDEQRLDGIFDISVTPLCGADGTMTACVHVARDITESKKMARQLAENEIRLRTLVRSIPDLVWLKDLDGRYLLCNRAFERLYGALEAEIIGKTDHDFEGRELADFYRAYDRQAATPVREPGSNEQGLTFAASGRKVFLETLYTPMHDVDGRLIGVLGIARDVTERRQAEEASLEMERKFQQTQKLESLGVLAGGIAHDFNNILTIIRGHCYIVDQDIDSGMDHKTHVKQIGSAAERAADLCRQMLTYAGKNSLVQTRINLRLMVDENVKMLNSAIKKNVSVNLYLEQGLPEITGDVAQIQQVVMNLIINSAEAIGEKQGNISIELKKTLVTAGQADRDVLENPIPPGHYLGLTVSDNGCGMDVETQKRVFEPFYTTKFAGRGLGMSAVLGIIKAHNGLLKLSSTPGVGTTFKVYFPVSEIPQAVKKIGLTAEVVPCLENSGVILLADDEEALRRVGSILLKAMGYSVLVAANGREALQIYRERGSGIDLILLDLLMPEMGGLETYRFVREISPSVPIVICSGYSLEDISEVIAGDAHVETIEKPYNLDQLRDTLAKLLSDSKLNSRISVR